jgi:hypothetical protein
MVIVIKSLDDGCVKFFFLLGHGLLPHLLKGFFFHTTVTELLLFRRSNMPPHGLMQS